MNSREQVLKFIANQFEKMEISFPVCEVYLPPGSSLGIQVQRTLFISGQPNSEEIHRLFENYLGGTLQAHELAIYNSTKDLLESSLISTQTRDASINWRGRLLKWESLAQLDTAEQFEINVLASFWRFIVTKKDDEYFARYDISPSYFNPGHSTPGFSNFIERTYQFLKYLIHLDNLGKIDSNHDRVVFFARKEPSKTFMNCRLEFMQANSMSYADFRPLIAKENREKTVVQIVDGINKKF